jgi:hypothetical protein
MYTNVEGHCDPSPKVTHLPELSDLANDDKVIRSFDSIPKAEDSAALAPDLQLIL